MLWLSLGENCLADDILKRHGLKSFSTPYSYCRSNIDYALTLEDIQYNRFLEKENLKYEEAWGVKVARSTIATTSENIFEDSVSQGFEFTNHDVISSDEALESLKQKVSRLAAVKGKENIVFLYHHRAHKNQDLLKLFEKLNNFIRHYEIHGKKCSIVCFTQSIINKNQHRHIESTSINSRILFFNLFTESLWSGNNPEMLWARTDDDLIAEMLLIARDFLKSNKLCLSDRQSSLNKNRQSSHTNLPNKKNNDSDTIKIGGTFTSIDKITVKRKCITQFSVLINGLQYDCRFNEKHTNDHLYVIFHGALQRHIHSVPAFARWNWHEIYKAPTLSVFDPMLYTNGELELSWFAGNKSQDVSGAIVELIENFSQKIDIDPNRIICYGSSGGGFAAMAVASRMRRGRFIALNPQIEITSFYESFINKFSKIFDSSKSPSENYDSFPTRWSITHALTEAQKKRADLSGVIAQNTLDLFHYEKHYTNYCNHFGIPIKGGSSSDGRLYSHLYTHENGHARESTEIAASLISTYSPILLSA